MTTITDKLRHAARRFVDPTTRAYLTSPPERQPDAVTRAMGVTGPYVSGLEVAQWPGELARFRATWEQLTPAQQDEALGVSREPFTVEVDEHGHRAVIRDGLGNEVEATRVQDAALACVTHDGAPGWPDLYFLDAADAHAYVGVVGGGRVHAFNLDERVAVNWRLPRLERAAPAAYAPDLIDAIAFVKIARTPAR